MIKDIVALMNEKIQLFASKAKKLGKKIGQCQIIHKTGYNCPFIQICFDDERTAEEAKRAIDYTFKSCFNASMDPKEYVVKLNNDKHMSLFEAQLDIVCPTDALSESFYNKNASNICNVKCWNPMKKHGGK